MDRLVVATPPPQQWTDHGIDRCMPCAAVSYTNLHRHGEHMAWICNTQQVRACLNEACPPFRSQGVRMSKPSEHSRALQNVTERRFVRDAIGRRGVQAAIAASLLALGGAASVAEAGPFEALGGSWSGSGNVRLPSRRSPGLPPIGRLETKRCGPCMRSSPSGWESTAPVVRRATPAAQRPIPDRERMVQPLGG